MSHLSNLITIYRKRIQTDKQKSARSAMDCAEAIGFHLKEAREANGWTMRETARRLGCSAVHYRDMEVGRKFPSHEMQRKLDLVLGGVK